MSSEEEKKPGAVAEGLAPKEALTEDERIASFNDECKALQSKYNLLLVAEPYIERGIVLARPVVFPRERLPQPKDE